MIEYKKILQGCSFCKSLKVSTGVYRSLRSMVFDLATMIAVVLNHIERGQLPPMIQQTVNSRLCYQNKHF